MRKPNLFIVGAPKSGTTAMDEYLGRHPEIFMADRKESHFFGRDLIVNYDRPTKKEYLSYFAPARDRKCIGEASVLYLVSKEAAGEIKAFSPAAKILVMLRNPVDMMPSLHAYKVYHATEDIEDFAAALEAEEDRLKGLRIPRSTRFVESLYYRRLGRYSAQVKRYIDVFGRENVHAIIFDDFKADTAGEYGKTLEFLGVDPDFAPEFRVINPTRKARSKLIQRLANLTLARSYRLRQTIPQSLRSIVRRLNTIQEGPAPMGEELRRQLQAEFAPEVERLSELLGRDLTHWTAG